MSEITHREKGHGGTSPRKVGFLSSANFPPLNIQKEGSSEEDKILSNKLIPTIETKIAGFAGQQEGQVSKRAAVGIGLTTGAIGLAAGAGGLYLATRLAPQNIDIGSFPNSFNNTEIKKSDGVFDNRADKSVVTENNTITLPLQQQRDQLGLDKENDTLTMTFPFDLPEGQSIVIERATSNWQPTQELLEETRRKGIKDDTVFKLPPGTTIKAPSFMKEEPAEYRIALVAGNPNYTKPQNPNMAGGSKIFAYYKEKDITIVASYSGIGSEVEDSQFNPLIPLIPFDQKSKWDWIGENWKNLPSVKPNDPIMRTAKQQTVELNIEVYKGQKIEHPEAQLIRTISLVTPIFPTTQEGKLIITP